MITWQDEDLARALLAALQGEHLDCGSDAVNCSTCLLMDEARMYFAAKDDRRKAADQPLRAPVSWAEQWDAQAREQGR